MHGTVQEFDVKMIMYQKAPNYLRQEIAASGLDQVIIFNGEKGIIKMGDEIQKILGEDLLKLRYDADMKLFLYPDSAGVRNELLGTVFLENNTAYKMRSSVGELEWFTYYDERTGFKVLEEKKINTPSGEFLQEIWFSDYKEVDGVKYPFKIEQILGPQELTFTISSIKLNQDLEDKLFEID
jgi:zinc protease